MPRKLKPQKVDEVRHVNLGVTVDIMLDRNDLDFFVTLGTETIRGNDPKLLRRQAFAMIEEQSKLEWKPCVRLSTGRATGVHVEAERFWYAVRANGTINKAAWIYDTDEKRLKYADSFYWDRSRQVPFVPPVRPLDYYRKPEPSIFLPYTDELWAAVEMLRSRLDDIKKHIEYLIGNDDGIASLQAIGSAAVSRLLPASTPTDR